MKTKTQISLSDLSQKEKLAIAEYIYSQQAGILIKSDAVAVIDVLKAHGIKAAETVEIEVYAILNLINSSIDQNDRELIMKSYIRGVL